MAENEDEAATKSETETAEDEHQAEASAAELEREEHKGEDPWQPIHSEVREVKTLVTDLAQELKKSNQQAADQAKSLEQLKTANQELTLQLQENAQKIEKLSTRESSPGGPTSPKQNEKESEDQDDPLTESEQTPPEKESSPPERARRRRRSI
jgi:chromosome segregation ATPase